MTDRRNLEARAKVVLERLCEAHVERARTHDEEWVNFKAIEECACEPAQEWRVIAELLEVARGDAQDALDRLAFGRYDRSYASPEEKAAQERIRQAMPPPDNEDP